jgi:hypothetical protein
MFLLGSFCGNFINKILIPSISVHFPYLINSSLIISKFPIQSISPLRFGPTLLFAGILILHNAYHQFLFLRHLPCTDGFAVFRQPLNQSRCDCFGLTFGFDSRNEYHASTSFIFLQRTWLIPNSTKFRSNLHTGFKRQLCRLLKIE